MMTPEQENELRDIRTMVTQIHGQMFGVNGHGSLLDRVDRLETRSEEMTTFKAKLLGVVGGVSLVASAIGSKLAHLLDK